MAVYLALIVISLLCYFFTKNKSKKKLFFVFSVVLFLVSAFRLDVGTDFKHYQDIFKWISEGKETYVEIGFLKLNQLLTWIFKEKSLCIFVLTSASVIASFCYVIKKYVREEYWFYAWFLFITAGVFFASLNAIRQYFAISILVFGLPFLMEKKYLKYLITILVATLFHTSAIVSLLFLMMVWLFKDKKCTPLLLLVFLGSLIFLVVDIRNFINLFSFLIPERWLSYLNSDTLLDRNYLAILKQIVPNIIVFFCLLNRAKLKEKNENFDVYLFGYYLACIINNFFFGILVLLRFGYFFDYFIIFLVPMIIDFFKVKNTKLFVSFLFILYFLILTIITIFIMNGQGVMPYKTIWG